MPSVLHRLARWAETDPETPAQAYKSRGQWKPISAREYMDRVYHLALFLESKGITSKDVGCILAPNSPEWVHMDLAVMLIGAKSAGLYPNSTPKDILYVLNHAEAKVLSVKDKEYYNKIVDEHGKAALPSTVELVVVFDGDTSISPQAVSYKDALSQGAKLAKQKGIKSLEQYLNQIDPQSGAFIIYTSGTTGNPKGAVLSHDNLVFTSDVAAIQWKLPITGGSTFSFLPLCHIAEKLQNIGVGISQRYTVNFCTKFENVAAELPEIQPTLLLCVPRLWEKMMEGVEHKLKSAPPARQTMARWAMKLGTKIADARYSRTLPNPLDYLQYKIADRIVLSKIRKALGLAQAEKLASGAAALSPHVSKWFRCIGLEILEDFGQTESTGVICMTEVGVESAGTVGKPVQGVDFKIAEDGEILCKGRNVFLGYFKDDASTAATLEEGWLHTGDLAEINERGLVKIRGRKKEVLKTSGGKMVAPLPIEEKLKAAPEISQVCMVGDGKKFLSVLVTLSEGTLSVVTQKSGAVSGKIIIDGETIGVVKKYIDDLNKTLASYEQIKKFTVLAKEFSIVDNEMTPTMKMKRNVIEKRYQDVINQMYGE